MVVGGGEVKRRRKINSFICNADYFRIRLKGR